MIVSISRYEYVNRLHKTDVFFLWKCIVLLAASDKRTGHKWLLHWNRSNIKYQQFGIQHARITLSRKKKNTRSISIQMHFDMHPVLCSFCVHANRSNFHVFHFSIGLKHTHDNMNSLRTRFDKWESEEQQKRDKKNDKMNRNYTFFAWLIQLKIASIEKERKN